MLWRSSKLVSCVIVASTSVGNSHSLLCVRSNVTKAVHRPMLEGNVSNTLCEASSDRSDANPPKLSGKACCERNEHMACDARQSA